MVQEINKELKHWDKHHNFVRSFMVVLDSLAKRRDGTWYIWYMDSGRLAF